MNYNMNKKKIEDTKLLREIFNLIEEYREEYFSKNKLEAKEIKSKITKLSNKNIRIKNIIFNISEGISDEGYIDAYLGIKELNRLEKVVEQKEREYLIYLKEKESKQYSESMIVLTFALVLVTSFLSANAILGNNVIPLIVFILGCSLFTFSIGIILKHTKMKNYNNISFSNSLDIIGFSVSILIILYFSFFV